MIFGLFLYSLGIALTVKANIGYAPWTVFHAGISNVTGLTLGVILILVGMVILILIKLWGETIGFGAVLNMLLIGIFLDIIMYVNIIPLMNSLLSGSIMMFFGLITIAAATYFYVGAAFGAGPRDSLMVVLARKTKKPVGLCRGVLELLILIIGWLLGGMVGIGTVLYVIGIGFCIQITFKILKFDATAIRHESFAETFAYFTGKKNDDG